MKRLTLATTFTIAVLLMCCSPSRIEAQADTKIVIKDGGSILLHADGLDAGDNWTSSAGEIKHNSTTGVLTGLQIQDGGTNRCGSDKLCGVNASAAWKIQINYSPGWVTIGSYSAEKGLHLMHHKLPFNQWKQTGSTDERQFGSHGDGHHITSVKVNGKNLCTSGLGCEVDVLFRP